MIIREQTVRPLSDLTENSENFLAELQQIHEPILLTVAGQGRIVVQDPESYQKMLDQIERFENIQSVREGIASIARGEGRPMEEFFAELDAELSAMGDE